MFERAVFDCDDAYILPGISDHAVLSFVWDGYMKENIIQSDSKVSKVDVPVRFE